MYLAFQRALHTSIAPLRQGLRLPSYDIDYYWSASVQATRKMSLMH